MKAITRSIAVTAPPSAKVVAAAAPSSAGVVYASSSNGGLVYGISNTSTVRTTEDLNCGSVAVRARYGTPGGNAWTSWTWNSSIVTQSNLPNVNLGAHRATYKTVFNSHP